VVPILERDAVAFPHPELQTILNTALQKESGRRHPAIRDMALALEEVDRHTEAWPGGAGLAVESSAAGLTRASPVPGPAGWSKA
jgi:hypothetical protein